MGCGVIMCNCVNVPMSQQYRGHSSPPLGPAAETGEEGHYRGGVERFIRKVFNFTASILYQVNPPLSLNCVMRIVDVWLCLLPSCTLPG